MGFLLGEFVYLMLIFFLYMVLIGIIVNYVMDLFVLFENREEIIGIGKR